VAGEGAQVADQAVEALAVVRVVAVQAELFEQRPGQPFALLLGGSGAPFEPPGADAPAGRGDRVQVVVVFADVGARFGRSRGFVLGGDRFHKGLSGSGADDAYARAASARAASLRKRGWRRS